MKRYSGVLAASCAYILWGILPAYWKVLQKVPSLEILGHRVVWSFLVTIVCIVCLGRTRTFLQAAGKKDNQLIFVASSFLIAINWLLYIWSVNNGYIVEASLGYFINPLVNVFFGMLFFKERMRLIQWLAIVCAAGGVVYLTLFYGRFPWISLVLAITFGTYGLLHKKTSLTSLDGLCLETAVCFIPALLYLIGSEIFHGGAFGHIGTVGSFYLAGAGFITTIPLLLFGFAAKNIPLSTLGLLQYLSPSISLFLGVYVYGEEFNHQRLIGFMCIWFGLLLFAAENLYHRFRMQYRTLASR